MRQTLIAVTLTAALLAGRPALLDQIWALLASFWSESTSDAGCGADPNGGCKPAPQLQSDAGCGADPNGCPK